MGTEWYLDGQLRFGRDPVVLLGIVIKYVLSLLIETIKHCIVLPTLMFIPKECNFRLSESQCCLLLDIYPAS